MTTADRLRAERQGKPGVQGATIITQSGLYFDFLNPTPEMIDPKDIAWGLARTCRFGGQCLDFYSVAQHSILVASLVGPEHYFAALMHDAAEAYVGDMVGPLKQLCPDYKAIEKRVEQAIFDKFGIPTPLDPIIKHADLCVLRTEQRDLTAGYKDAWTGLDEYKPLPKPIHAWDMHRAGHEWLSHFFYHRPPHLHRDDGAA